MKDKFIQFLKNNGAYEKFCKNCKDDISSLVFDDVFNLYEPISYMSVAFTWRGTPQGYDYWSKLDTKWMKLLNSESNG